MKLTACCVLAIALWIAGCTAVPSTRVIATPWGGVAVHSFTAPPAQENKALEIDAQTAQLLDEIASAQAQGAARLASR
jgi:hypothetical protein